MDKILPTERVDFFGILHIGAVDKKILQLQGIFQFST